MQSYFLVTLVSLVIGCFVIFLSYHLPRFARETDETEVAANAPPKKLLTMRNLIVVLLIVGLGLYLTYYRGISIETYAIFFFTITFILIAVIDFEHHLVLDVLMIPLFCLALLEIFIIKRVTPLYAFSGFSIAQIFLMGIYLLGQVFLWIVNSSRLQEDRITEVPFGFGDVTLAAYCGLIVGLPYVVVMLFLMIIVGGIIALLYLVVSHIVFKYRAFSAIPYGPAIVIAAAIMLIWGDPVMQALGVVY